MVEEGELPDAAILRELMEEFEIEVSKLTLLLVHTEHDIEYQGIYYGFTADLVTPLEEVKCNEGKRVEFFHIKSAIKLPQHPVSHIFLQQYIESETSDDANNNCCHSEP
jgi:8-oxo-dGTP pyrophosphatase MutT (NUDIX family)